MQEHKIFRNVIFLMSNKSCAMTIRSHCLEKKQSSSGGKIFVIGTFIKRTAHFIRVRSPAVIRLLCREARPLFPEV